MSNPLDPRCPECGAELSNVKGWIDALNRVAASRDALAAWASRMPDAGFTSEDPRWAWWHERPR